MGHLAAINSNKTHILKFQATKAKTLAALGKKFAMLQLDNLLREYGIAESYEHLTNSQAKYIPSFRDLESLKRVLQAK